MNTLCVVTDCYLRNRHDPNCTDPTCNGCLPGLALDTLRICRHHYENAKTNLRELPHLDRDLGEAFVTRTSMITAYTTGSPGSIGINLDDHVLEAREYMRGRLTNLAAYIVTERNVAVPDLTVTGLVAFLLRHAEWLSADQTAAPTWTKQIANIRSEARKYAYRSRSTSFKMGKCPGTAPDGAICATTIRYEPSDYAGTDTITCPGCGTTATPSAWRAKLNPEQARHVIAEDAAAVLTDRYGRDVPAGTIRSWASKGRLGKHHEGRRTYFDLDEVITLADTIWTPLLATA